MWRVQLFYIVTSLFYFIHPRGCEVTISLWFWFAFISSMANDAEHFFMAIYRSLEKYLFRSLAYLFNSVLLSILIKLLKRVVYTHRVYSLTCFIHQSTPTLLLFPTLKLFVKVTNHLYTDKINDYSSVFIFQDKTMICIFAFNSNWPLILIFIFPVLILIYIFLLSSIFSYGIRNVNQQSKGCVQRTTGNNWLRQSESNGIMGEWGRLWLRL